MKINPLVGGRHGRKNNVPPSQDSYREKTGKTAQLAGLNAYTVREYKRKYAAGDNSWAYRGGISV